MQDNGHNTTFYPQKCPKSARDPLMGHIRDDFEEVYGDLGDVSFSSMQSHSMAATTKRKKKKRKK